MRPRVAISPKRLPIAYVAVTRTLSQSGNDEWAFQLSTKLDSELRDPPIIPLDV